MESPRDGPGAESGRLGQGAQEPAPRPRPCSQEAGKPRGLLGKEWLRPCASLNIGCFLAWFRVHWDLEWKRREFPQSLPPAPPPRPPLLQRLRDTWAVPSVPVPPHGCPRGGHADVPRALSLAAAGRAGVCARPTQPGPSVSTVLAYMQLLEDYSEPQPSMFYQTPQKEHVYQQKNKLLMEVYGFNDSFSAGDAPHELAPPPALPPKQRQLVSGGAPHQRPGTLAPLSCWNLALQEWLLLQSGPLQLGLACIQNVCFLCGQSFFSSVSLLWFQYRPP